MQVSAPVPGQTTFNSTPDEGHISSGNATLELSCLVEGDRTIFYVHVPSINLKVANWKEFVYGKGKDRVFVKISPKDLELWKVDIDLNTRTKDSWASFNVKDGDEGVEELKEWKRILDYWQAQPATERLQVFVKLPAAARSDAEGRPTKRPRLGVEGHGSPPELKLLKKELCRAAPSSLAHADNFRKIAGPGHLIISNRPFVDDTVPIDLLCPAFGIFKARCREPPSRNALAFLEELAPIACQWYGTDLQRRVEVQKVFHNHTRLRFHTEAVPGAVYTTDGNLTVNIMPGCIRGVKNEHGNALSRVIVYYGKFLEQPLTDLWNYNTRFPCILLVDCGSTFGFYGAVWDGHVRVEPLAATFNLSTHHMDENGRHAIASGLDAFMAAVDNIEAHYKDIAAAAKANTLTSDTYDRPPAEARKYPYETSFKINGRDIGVVYESRLIDSKLLFTAIDSPPNSDQYQPNSDPYIVKFARRYSETAHTCLADLDLAPKLWQCKKIPGGWMAVIMKRSGYELVYGLSLSEETQEKVRSKVTKIVKMLHDKGFVHGDIRDTNLLVDRKSLSSGDIKIHVIDFDWAGKAGVAEYPVGVNTISMRRPAGVDGGVLITKEHDEEMISYLFR